MLSQVVIGWGFVMLIGMVLPSVLPLFDGLNPAAAGFAFGAVAGMLLGVSYGLVLSLYIPKSKLPSLRFSLRTLLLATTLVAVALGLIVYAMRG
jgi:hypothetical protein